MDAWQDVIEFINAHQCQWSLSPDEGEWGIHQLDTPPHNRLLGPVFPRGETAGVVCVDGEVQCRWGDTARADMTFSVTKTYLAMVAGIAVDRGLITSVDETVSETLTRHQLGCEPMQSAHNSQITWKNFLQFTSEWQGTCCGIPDQIDHYRNVSMQPTQSSRPKGALRPLSTPGSYWEYNDVRINQCAMLLTQLFDQALPEIFTQQIMQPLGAGNHWQWHGYHNSDVILRDGSVVKSVPGGGHWGGGMVISVDDQLRLAQLLLNQGEWHGQQLLSPDWVRSMTTPCDIAPWYGYFLWLNTNHSVSQAAPESSFFAMGIGGQLIWHDPSLKLAAVFRWIDVESTEQIIEKTLLAL